MDIQPGSKVKITVKSRLATARAQKTLARLFMKDSEIAKTRCTDPKPVRPTPRAGRLWAVRPQGTSPRPPEIGDSATVLATVDVIRDINSVEKYVEIA